MENKIKEFRESAKLSQDDLADKLGVTEGTLGTWERGKSEPTFFNAICLAECLGVRVEDLFQIEQPTGPIPHREMNKLEQLRRSAGVSARELAEFCEVSHTTITNCEKFGSAPSIYVALRLARAFGTTVEELFSP